MNHFAAKQRKSDGRWDYTCNSRPTGYCHELVPIQLGVGWMSDEQIIKHNEEMEQLKHHFHIDGHATEDEACDCYKRYLLDTALKLTPQEPENAHQQNRCQVCKKFTACIATVGPYRLFILCPEHQNREEIEKLLKVGESWES